MNLTMFHVVALKHHGDLLRGADQQRRARLAQQPKAQPPRPPVARSLSTSSTPCLTR